MFHCLLWHYSKSKIFASAGGAHPLLHSHPHWLCGCHLPTWTPLFKIAGSAPVETLAALFMASLTPTMLYGTAPCTMPLSFSFHFFKVHIKRTSKKDQRQLLPVVKHLRTGGPQPIVRTSDATVKDWRKEDVLVPTGLSNRWLKIV